MSPRGTKRKSGGSKKEDEKTKTQEAVESASEDEALSAEEAPKSTKRRSAGSKKEERAKSPDSGEESEEDSNATKSSRGSKRKSIVPKKSANSGDESEDDSVTAKSSRGPKRKFAGPKKSAESDEESEEESSNVKMKNNKKKLKPSKAPKETEETEENDKNESENEGGDEQSTDENEASKEENFEVEKIVGDRLNKGKIQYKIRWKGYESSEDTWENLSDLDCEDMLKEYNKESSKKPGRKQKKGKKKENKENGVSKKRAPSNPEPNSDDEYEIEKVIDMHTCRNGQREFLVRWKGYSKDDDTWEPEANLEGKEVLNRFLQKLEKIKEVDQRALRVNPKHTDIFTAIPPDSGRRISKRNSNQQRVKYYEAE